MSEEKNYPFTKQASLFWNGHVFFINTVSRFFKDDSCPDHELLNHCSHAELGVALRAALDCSKPNPKEHDPELYASGLDGRARLDLRMQRHKTLLEARLKRYGYKNQKAMYKKMENCGVDLIDGNIVIQPMTPIKIDTWTRPKDWDVEDVLVPYSADPETIGAAAREALARCLQYPNRRVF